MGIREKKRVKEEKLTNFRVKRLCIDFYLLYSKEKGNTNFEFIGHFCRHSDSNTDFVETILTGDRTTNQKQKL